MHGIFVDHPPLSWGIALASEFPLAVVLDRALQVMNRTIAIADPYSGGALFARAFGKRGRPCVMVQSTEEIPEQFRSTVDKSDFVDVVLHGGDDDATMERLRQHDVEFVLAGCDMGIEPAARWSEGLGLVGNGAKLATARRDKHLMTESVQRRGLATASQLRAGTVREALAWILDGDRWPVVLKPLASTGSDAVRACRNEEEATRAFEAIIGHRNVLGQRNEAVLVQEYLVGTEYVIDTVSWEGQHRLAGVWRYLQNDSGPAPIGYDAMQLLEGEGELQDGLLEYTRRVLDALEIRYGPAHCELMWVKGEPILVEVAARLNGGVNCWINRLCSGLCQLDLTVEAYTDPGRFLEGLGRRYRLEKHVINVFLKSPASGVLKAVPRRGELEALVTHYDSRVSARPGRPVPRVAGIVTLLHEDRTLVEADLERIHELEANGLFEVETVR